MKSISLHNKIKFPWGILAQRRERIETEIYSDNTIINRTIHEPNPIGKLYIKTSIPSLIEYIHIFLINQGVCDKKVDWDTVVIDGVDSSDYPKFCDAYISEAYYNNGDALTENELDKLTEENYDYVNQEAFESLL